MVKNSAQPKPLSTRDQESSCSFAIYPRESAAILLLVQLAMEILHKARWNSLD